MKNINKIVSPQQMNIVDQDPDVDKTNYVLI